MKTREQAKARALELYPIHEEFDVDRLKPLREAYLQGWEEAQQDKQTCGFCVEPASKTIKEAFDNIPKKVRDRHAKAAYEEHKQLREAAAKVTAFWRVNPSIVKDWEKDMHEFIEKLEKELK